MPLGGLSVALAVPFRDERGEARTETVEATGVEQIGGDVVATFRLTDQWARLCYGALAVPGFQARAAGLVASYTFAAYVPVREREAHVAWGGKRAVTDLALVSPAGNGRETPRVSTAILAGAAASGPITMSPATIRPTVAKLAVHAQLIAAPNLVAIRPEIDGIRSQGRTSRVEAAFPCGEFGAFYLQATDAPGASEVAIGCRDALTLGQIQFRLYEPLAIDLGTPRPGLRVYRSLQVPGRFLIVPEAYTIARFEPGDARAYRPAIYLFSNVDADQPERGNCILLATLQPAVPPFRRRQLLAALRQYHPEPILEWPTELATTPTYSWAIADSGAGPGRITPAAARVPDGFQVSLATGLAGAMGLKTIVERAGVGASVTFPLGDGTSLSSTLLIDLARIDGPWSAGPVEVARAGGAATLRSRIEQPLDVADLLLYTGGVPSGVVAVERRLAADAAVVVEGLPDADEIVPRYAPAGGPGALDEVRTFIEDIYTNVVFLGSLERVMHFGWRARLSLSIVARRTGSDGSRSPPGVPERCHR